MLPLLACGLLMSLAGAVCAQESSPPADAAYVPPATQRSAAEAIDMNLRNAMMIARDLKETFASGAVTKGTAGDRPDARMNILVLLVQDKIRSMVKRRIADPTEQEAALAQLQVVEDHLKNEILPAWHKARASQRPEDAKALVALMDGFDDRITKMQQVLPRQASPAVTESPAGEAPPVPAARPGTSIVPHRPPVAMPPATAPTDAWTRHVQQFIVTYKLDGTQQEQAWSILKDLAGRRQEYLASHRPDYEAAGRIPDAARRSAELQALDKPVQAMFEELKNRLANIPTQQQRKPVTSRPGSPVIQPAR